ncbi:hypothetical protein NH26_19520 [Flammeovirga pacifica]|uniref:Uncharacterized protein n=1 Tax=Flammeovirga pacifica TaxID=915059 RepID=A0A1S1YZ85_FLAPC|nr:hypothetical protein NH26_00980 [Flammeovirga pacifica]OHX65398.1 hypothetical protein NH26_03065 [Flammeovirga pacifica]OHX66243.1 hypothetical protein NH26_07700 [Flammeovirga pacifica]OHX68382.1 hypothetical protein NH26_19520 [Flammeovirga pacifica]
MLWLNDVDVAVINGKKVSLLGEISSLQVQQEKSAEVVVGNKSTDKFRRTHLTEGLKVTVSQIFNGGKKC